MTLPNPVSVIDQITVLANGTLLRPINDYQLSSQTLTFTSPKSNVEVRIKYLIGNTAYDVIRNYDYSLAHSFTVGDAIIVNSGQIAKNKLYRIGTANTTTLAQPLTWGDTEITLSDAIDLPTQQSTEARMAKPGVVWIDGERIEFWRRDGNKLRQLVRATGGTSCGFVEDSNSNYRSQTATITGFTQVSNAYTFQNIILNYINVGDIISVNNEIVHVLAASNNGLTIDQLLNPSNTLEITVFKPRPTQIAGGTPVHNGSGENQFSAGYDWIASPFGLQYNTVDAMGRFINFANQ